MFQETNNEFLLGSHGAVVIPSSGVFVKEYAHDIGMPRLPTPTSNREKAQA